jgi:hypothetical protein
MKPIPAGIARTTPKREREEERPMARFVEFTNARTNKPVWVNPDHVRNAQTVLGHKDWTQLAMGGEGQDVGVQGGLKSVLEILKGAERLPLGEWDPA